MVGEKSVSRWREPIVDGLSTAALGELLHERFAAEVDPLASDGCCWVVPAERVHEVVQFLRDDERVRCAMLLDITAVDYLAYPGWRDERFAVVYVLKSLSLRHRVRIKAMLEEDEIRLATVSDLFRIADWLERETYDQYGIEFVGHPNLKRLLNHHEFVGHPLRKDYPVQKRQHLSVNDPMGDELGALLERRGYRILEDDEVTVGGDAAVSEDAAEGSP